jgi:para-aminobenzoate synthetase
VRYHSLVVDPHSLPATLRVIARTPKEHDIGVDDIIQGLAHTSRPHFGVQFHPESVATTFGAQLLRNFACLARATPWVQHIATGQTKTPRTWRSGIDTPLERPLSTVVHSTQVHWCRIHNGAACGSEALFRACVVDASTGDADTWWLDSSSTASSRARFSFMGGRWGRAWQAMTFRLDAPGMARSDDGTTGVMRVRTADGQITTLRSGASLPADFSPRAHSIFADVLLCVITGCLDFLERQLAEHSSVTCKQHPGPLDGSELPFEFWGGWVGYIGYELRAESLPSTAARRHESATPDAALFNVTCFLAVDHDTDDVYVVTSSTTSDDIDGEAQHWLSTMVEQVRSLNASAVQANGHGNSLDAVPSANAAVWDGEAKDAPVGAFALRVTKEGYKRDVRSCMEHIAAGDTYEVCLTTALERVQGHLKPLELYTTLRHGNPAPYAAYLRFSSGSDGVPHVDDLAVCCSSPERFLRIGKDRRAEAKPIKGTAARVVPHGCPDDVAAAEELRSSVKDRAENLMIVDLLRNDLGRVCCPGSMHVPALCAVESFASVHQLVSTVRGVLRDGISTVRAVRACFPGGSMTGAPKLRTCNIIDGIESRARGVYSGALGFFSINGASDLNIVIRTAVVHGDKITVGAGGAVVALSDVDAEYNEMRLKARAVVAATIKASAAQEV